MLNDGTINFIKCQVVFFSFLALIVYILSISGFEVNPVGILYIVAFYMAIVPFFLTKSLLNPICIYSIILILQLLDFGLQNALGMGLRYYPDLSDQEVERLRVQSLIIIMTWTFFLGVGYFAVFKSGGLNPPKQEDYRSKNPWVQDNKRAIFFFSIFCAVLSVQALLMGISVTGGFSEMVEAMGDRSDAYQGYGYLRTFAQFGMFGAIGLLYIRKKYTSLIVLAVSFFSTIMFGGRGAAMLGVFLPYVFFWNWHYSKISTKSILLYGVVGIVFVFVMEIFKYQNREFVFDMNRLLFSVSRGMADILPSMLHAIETGALNYQYGRTILNVFLIIIPRSLWPSKPEGLGEDALLGRALIGDDYWGIPPGAYGVAYLNFSYMGVIFFAFINGLFSKYLFNKFCSSKAGSIHFWFYVFYPFVFLKVFNFYSVYSLLQFFVALFFSYFLFKFCSLVSKIRIYR